MVPRNDVDAGAALHEAADLVDLEAAVHGAYAGETRGIHGVGSLRGGIEICIVLWSSLDIARFRPFPHHHNSDIDALGIHN